MISGVREYVEITGKGLTIIDRDGNKQILEADSIATALPLTPNNELLEKLESTVPEVYAIGDCNDPLLITDAIGTGLRTAREV